MSHTLPPCDVWRASNYGTVFRVRGLRGCNSWHSLVCLVPEKAQAEEETLKEISISDLKENQVVFVTCDSLQFPGHILCIAGRVHFVLNERVRAQGQCFTLTDMWTILPHSEGEERRLAQVSRTHVRYNAKNLKIQLLGVWNPETNRVDSVE